MDLELTMIQIDREVPEYLSAEIFEISSSALYQVEFGHVSIMLIVKEFSSTMVSSKMVWKCLDELTNSAFQCTKKLTKIILRR